MIVNGVTLPDIPDEAKVYSNFVVMRSIQPGSEAYMLIGCAGGTLVVKDSSPLDPSMPDVYHSWLYLSKPLGIYERFEDGEWTFDSGASGTGYQKFPIPMVTAELDGELMSIDVFWADHVVMEATLDGSGVPVSTGVQYYPKEPKPDRVSIGHSLVDGYAREVQRLTGTTEQMNAVQIREKLATVKAGIKIGDTVLPPIPDGVLAEYPYAMIGLNSDYNMYLLGVSDTPFAYLPAELTTTGNAFITTVGFRHKFYAYDGSAWVFQNENSTERIYQELNETIGVCWANDDICTITSRTDAQGEITVGTEVYFSERQNFNGVWLPKIPEDVLKQYPYNVILKISRSGMTMYMLAGLTEELTFAPKEIATTVVECDGILYTKQPCTIASFMYIGAGSWIEQGVSNNDTFKVHVGMPEMSYDVFWSNSDVCIATAYDTATNIATIGTDLYFPPLPTIDTDRVSMGYDLCDGIVEEVQRLSGETDKMNALRAYWKLTTVV